MIENERPYWNFLEIQIFEAQPGTWLGSYVRRYHSMYDTFLPFLKDGKDYALYSADYTATHVMALPSAVDIAGEKGDFSGFCPVDYLVPYDPSRGLTGKFGFVAGCIWGDDSTWKIEYLDLSGIDRGDFVRYPAFGYREYTAGEWGSMGQRLRDMIDLSEFTPENPIVGVESLELLIDPDDDYPQWADNRPHLSPRAASTSERESEWKHRGYEKRKYRLDPEALAPLLSLGREQSAAQKGDPEDVKVRSAPR